MVPTCLFSAIPSPDGGGIIKISVLYQKRIPYLTE
jgi:hypothetical protein